MQATRLQDGNPLDRLRKYHRSHTLRRRLRGDFPNPLELERHRFRRSLAFQVALVVLWIAAFAVGLAKLPVILRLLGLEP